MAKTRRPRKDWPAWALLALGLVLAVSVLSFEPPHADAGPASSNLLGPVGDWIGGQLLSALGVSVYLLLVSWFNLVLLLLLRVNRWTWLGKLTGWLFLLPWCALAAEVIGTDLLTSTLAIDGHGFSGGALGELLYDCLCDNFPFAGRVLVASGWLLVGAYLTADVVVLRALLGLWRILRAMGLWLGVAGLGLTRCLRSRVRENAGEATSAGDDPPRSHERGYGDDLTSPQHDSADIPIHRPALAPLPAVPSKEVSAPTILPIIRPMPAADENEHRFDKFELPPMGLLEDPQPFPYEAHDQKLRDVAVLLEKTFKDFELNVRVVGINTGPVITQYEVALETGLRLNKVTNLSDDLALNLKVPSVRIVAPIPGKNTVGIEIPNEHRAVVRMKEVILTASKKDSRAKLPLFLGKDTEGKPLIYDLAEMPHLLIAGRTGTGKSVCMNAIILSLLMTRRPDECKMIMIDPKMLEMSEYGKIPHLMHPVVKDMKKAEAILGWAVDKMEERYDLLSRARVRGIAGYNELSRTEVLNRVQPDDEEARRIPEKMPYIVIFVDEMNDLMMTMKREVEGHIIRLAQKSRAAGIHLVVATQKPTVDVITGLIKSNLPARICFQVSSRSDSRVVLDEMGAEKLLGKGDMLFLQPGTSTILRSQGTYASDDEITRVVKHLECDEPCFATELIQLKNTGEAGGIEKMRARDDVYEQAVDIVIREGRGSVSLLQRALGIGYGRAARLIDFMAEDGVVGVYNGSNARDVLLTPEEWQQMREGSLATGT